MGKIIREAGGAISNGKSDILEVVPKSIDELTPIYVGGRKEIAMIEKFMAQG